jgi:hypothetical protein
MRCPVQNFRFLFFTPILIGMIVCLPPEVSPQVPASNPVPNVQNPDTLVRKVIHNEIEAQLHDNSLWCYRENQQEDGKPEQTLEVCQTKDGDLERLVAVNGRELNSAQTQAEDQRLEQAISHPEQLRAKQKKAREDGEQQRNMLKSLPDAFRFDCESESGHLVTLRFHPNPAFHAYTRAALVFHHLEGTLVLDTKQQRLVEIDGRLTTEVRFAGGLLGHLDKNGTFLVKQQEVAPGHWDLSYLSVHMSGRALFFKTINVLEKKSLVDYQRLPQGASLQQAADFLTHDFDIHTASSSGK